MLIFQMESVFLVQAAVSCLFLCMTSSIFFHNARRETVYLEQQLDIYSFKRWHFASNSQSLLNESD